MTRQKLEKTIDWALARQGVPNRAPLVAAVADAIDLTLSMEASDDDPHPVESHPALDIGIAGGQDVTTKSRIAPLPLSPSVTKPPEGRLIIMPDEANRSNDAFSKILQAELKPDIVIPPPREGSGPRGEPTYWKPEALSKVLHENTPATLKIQIEHPERGQVSITLDRNVVVGYGFDTVKLSYKHANAPEEFQVAETFSITQKELPITQALERIRRDAVQVYSPKQRGLPARQPAYQGPAQVPTIDPNTPHDSV